MFRTPCIAVFPTHFSQLDLNPANLEATVEAEWILAFLFCENSIFQWRHNYVIIGHFIIFQSLGLSGWFVPKIVKRCLNLSKLRPKYYRSLIFWDTVYIENFLTNQLLKESWQVAQLSHTGCAILSESWQVALLSHTGCAILSESWQVALLSHTGCAILSDCQ